MTDAALLPILLVPDPRLRAKAKPVAAGDGDAVRALSEKMLAAMYAAPGIGLAAPQVGELTRVVVMDLGDKPVEGASDDPQTEEEALERRNPRFFVNPEILWSSEEMFSYEEGCLSIPTYYDAVERPARVRVRYMNYQGETIEEEIEGLYAVCFQHELDHLNGVLFIDHLSRLRRDRAVSKVKKHARMAA